MRAGIRISSLVPSGLVIESVSDSSDSIILAVRSEAGMAECPLCGARSRRIHSRYHRDVADLPSAGKQVRLLVITRRFVCEVPHCRRQIFAERFGDDVLPTRARRTARLECIVHHLGLALGGRPAASFAKRLMLPVSNDTLLRVVRRRTRLRTEPLIVHRYGTIVCDLERRRIVTLLPDRETATVRTWLSDHPEIRVVSRDRGGGYGEAAAKALPAAVQVADRWHLMENASAAFLNAVRRSMRAIRTAVGATTINPELLTRAERLQYEGYLRRKQTNEAIMALVRDAVPLKEIVRRTEHSRKLVRQVSRGESTDVFRTRQSTLDALALSGRAMDRGLPQRRRALASLARARLPWLLACSQRVDDTATTSREGDQSTTAKSSFRENYLVIDDHRARQSWQSRNSHYRRHRGARSHTRRSPRARRKLSGHGAKEAHRKSRSMDRYRQREPDRVFCEWDHSRQGRRPCRPHRALVEWPDRRADHEAKAGKTLDVWTGEDRPSTSPAARRHLVTQTVIEVASEPLFHAETHPPRSSLCRVRPTVNSLAIMALTQSR